MKLKTAVAEAARLAYEEDADQVVGRIDGTWAVAGWENAGRVAQMARPIFRVTSQGLDCNDVIGAMEQAEIEGDQDWENETTRFEVDDEVIACSWPLVTIESRVFIDIANPFTSAWVRMDVTDLTENELDAYALLMDDEVREELHSSVSPCSPGEFLSAWVDRVGPDEAGKVILGS